MKHYLPLIFLIAVAADAQQSGGSSGVDAAGSRNQTQPTGASQISPQDQQFLQQLAKGGQAEVQQGKLAQTRARSPEVRAFAERMVSDHGQANQRVTALARSKNVAPVMPSQAEDPTLARLRAAQAAEFDLQYMQAQVDNHQRTVQLLQQQASRGASADTRQLAQELLPTVSAHLDQARDIMIDLSQPAAGGSGSTGKKSQSGSSNTGTGTDTDRSSGQDRGSGQPASP
jgi:putative membrane protein